MNLRPVYTGDFCCDFSGDFCCDFAAISTIAVKLPVVHTGDLKSPRNRHEIAANIAAKIGLYTDKSYTSKTIDELMSISTFDTIRYEIKH